MRRFFRAGSGGEDELLLEHSRHLLHGHDDGPGGSDHLQDAGEDLVEEYQLYREGHHQTRAALQMAAGRRKNLHLNLNLI